MRVTRRSYFFFLLPLLSTIIGSIVKVAAVVSVLASSTTKVVAGMRIVVQRVKSASVTVDTQIVSQIGPGIVALVGLHEKDTIDDLQYCCKRLLGCKLWENSETGGQWRHSVKQKQYECLLVSQFTLYGTLSHKKYQPDYKLAMKAVEAEQLYREFVSLVQNDYQRDKVFDGVFGAMMDVSLVNDGPVTIIIESQQNSQSQLTTSDNNSNNNNGTPTAATDANGED